MAPANLGAIAAFRPAPSHGPVAVPVETAADHQLTGLRVLLVEDERAIRTMLARYLSSIGFEVTTAAEPEEAAALLENRPFDALLTDLSLSGLGRSEGFDVLRRARYRNESLRIVVLTGAATPELRDACLREGADVFLSKPQPLARLAEALSGIENPS